MQMPETAQQGTCDAVCAMCRAPFSLAAVRPLKKLEAIAKELPAFSRAPHMEVGCNSQSDARVIGNHTDSVFDDDVQAQQKAFWETLSEDVQARDEEVETQSGFDLDETLVQEMEARLDAEIGADSHNKETFGETNGWSFRENVTANLRIEEQSAPVPTKASGSKWRRAGRHRVKLIQDIFHACDITKIGRLQASDMCTFASHTGFNGSTDEWVEEYKILCEDRGIDAGKGFACQEFVDLVNDVSENGCYCTDTELQAIHDKMTQVSSSF